MQAITSFESLANCVTLEKVTITYPDIDRKFFAVEMTGLERDIYDTQHAARVKPAVGLGRPTLDFDRLGALLIFLSLCGSDDGETANGKRIWDTSVPLAVITAETNKIRQQVPGFLIRRLHRDLMQLNKINETAEREIEKN